MCMHWNGNWFAAVCFWKFVRCAVATKVIEMVRHFGVFSFFNISFVDGMMRPQKVRFGRMCTIFFYAIKCSSNLCLTTIQSLNTGWRLLHWRSRTNWIKTPPNQQVLYRVVKFDHSVETNCIMLRKYTISAFQWFVFDLLIRFLGFWPFFLSKFCFVLFVIYFLRVRALRKKSHPESSFGVRFCRFSASQCFECRCHHLNFLISADNHWQQKTNKK